MSLAVQEQWNVARQCGCELGLDEFDTTLAVHVEGTRNGQRGATSRDRNPTNVQHVYVSQATLTSQFMRALAAPSKIENIPSHPLPLSTTQPRIRQRGSTYKFTHHRGVSGVLTFNYMLFIYRPLVQSRVRFGVAWVEEHRYENARRDERKGLRDERWKIVVECSLILEASLFVAFESPSTVAKYSVPARIARHWRGDDVVNE